MWVKYHFKVQIFPIWNYVLILGLAAPYTDGNIDMSDEGTRRYYRGGYIELVKAYHKKGIINNNQAKKLISWVERDMHLDRDTQEYEEILDYIKRHFHVFRW